jgi:hypothetical protein
MSLPRIIELLINYCCFSFALLIHFSCSAIEPIISEKISAEGTINTVQTVIDDMKLPHEGKPHGVPKHWDWANGPKKGLGNNPGRFRAMIATGKVYEDIWGNPAKNTRVQIRNLEAYYLSRKDATWHLLQQSSTVDGKAFREDFKDDYSRPADIRREPSGGISVKAGGGFNFHFWSPNGRTLIDPTDINGIFVTVQARLIVDQKNLPDDRHLARYLLSVGGDYWINKTARWAGTGVNNNDISLGRFKYVTIDWKAFNMSTLNEYEIRQNPPPLR